MRTLTLLVLSCRGSIVVILFGFYFNEFKRKLSHNFIPYFYEQTKNDFGLSIALIDAFLPKERILLLKLRVSKRS